MNIESILSSDSHWNVNKKLAKEIGVIPTILLMELVFCRKKYKEAEFFESAEKLEESLGIGRELRRSGIKILSDFGFITVQKKGIPARYWFQICDKNIYDFLLSETAPDTASDTGSNPSSDTASRSTIIKNIIIKNKNKNIYTEQNSEETSNHFSNINKDSSNKVVSNKTKEQSSEESGIAENHPSHAVEIGQISSTINLEKSLGAELSKGSRDSEKTSQNASKSKIAKSVVDAFYSYYKELNDSFGEKMEWDSKQTKLLKEKLLEALLPIDKLLGWKPNFISQENSYFKILEPVWRLKISRSEKNSDFYKKKFLPSTFTVKYTDCLPQISYYKIKDEIPDPDLDGKLEALNKKLKVE
jgi:hypothetical protein